MKMIVIISALATLLCGMSVADDKKPEPPKEALFVPATQKPLKLTLQSEGSNEINLKKISLKGPIIALARSDKPLQVFNPLAPSKSAPEPTDFKVDPYLGRPCGIVLFSLRF